MANVATKTDRDGSDAAVQWPADVRQLVTTDYVYAAWQKIELDKQVEEDPGSVPLKCKFIRALSKHPGFTRFNWHPYRRRTVSSRGPAKTIASALLKVWLLYSISTKLWGSCKMKDRSSRAHMY